MQISVKSDIEQALAAYSNLAKNLQRKAVTRAMNRTITMARTQASKEIRQVYQFSASNIKATMTIRRATPTRIEASIRSRGRRTPVVDFLAKQTSAGVSVRITKQRKVIQSGFIATMKSGHRGAFKRRGKKRLPIDELYTIAIPEAFASKQIGEALQRLVAEVFPRRLEHEIKFLLQKRDSGPA